MSPTPSVSDLSSVRHLMDDVFTRFFPPPQFLTPPAAGIDISDASIKWLTLAPDKKRKGQRVASWGSEDLPNGAVINGSIQESRLLVEALRVLKEHGTIRAHAALPEEGAFVFSMHVPEKTSREHILSMIEFELQTRVPLPPEEATFDFTEIMRHDDGVGTEIGVSVVPRDLAESYTRVFEDAGIELLSLEIEAQAIARAIAPRDSDEIVLLVDFGHLRTGLAVLKRGIPIFTSTVEVGGNTMTHAVMKQLSLTAEEAQRFKNDEGLTAKSGPHAAGLEAVSGTAAALGDEVARTFHFWDTRRNERQERVTPVSRVILVGGTSNLKGLPDYIAGRVQAPAERANVWRHVCSFDDYIPPIDVKTSLQYATAIGLALRNAQ